MNDVVSLINQQAGFGKWCSSDGILSRLECRRKEQFWHVITSSEVNHYDPPVFACKFAQKKGYEHMFAIANEDGQIGIHDTHNRTPRHGVHAHNNAIFDLAWLFNQMKLVSASGDHTAALFHIREAAIDLEDVYHGHTKSIKAVACPPDDSALFATGGRDGRILIWDMRCHDRNLRAFPDATLNDTHPLPHSNGGRKLSSRQRHLASATAINSVTSLVYRDAFNLISCGAADGFINIWDMRKTYTNAKRRPLPKWQLSYPGTRQRTGFSNLLLSGDSLKLYASCLDSAIYCFNVSTFDVQPIMTYRGHTNGSFYVKSALSGDGRYLLSGSSDAHAYIWTVEGAQPVWQLGGHEAEVTCVAWRQRGEPVLVTCSDDLRHNVWRVGVAEEAEVERDRDDVVGVVRELRAVGARGKRAITADWVGAKRVKRQQQQEERLLRVRNANEDVGVAILGSEISPKRVKLTENEENGDVGTIMMMELPNFNVDGVAPHVNTSPLKRADVDWLTKLRLRKRSYRFEGVDEEATLLPSAAKSARTVTRSPRTRTTPQKNRGRQSPILKFFKVTNASSGASPCAAKAMTQSTVVANVQKSL